MPASPRSSAVALHGRTQLRLLCTGALLLGALPAQRAEPQSPTPRLQGEPHLAGSTDAAPWLERTHLTGDWGGLRTWLAERGVTPELYSSTDGSWLAAGGRDPRGTEVRTLVDATLTIDTERLLGHRGGTLFVDLQLLRGGDGSEDTGDLQRYSDIDHTHEFEEVAMLWFRQSFADDQLYVKLGKDDVNEDFAAVEHGDAFLHAAFGYSPTVLGLPTYPDTSFGAQLGVRTERFFGGVGVYDGAGQAGFRTGERGASTLFGSPEDLFLIAEAGLRWAGERPGRAAVGAWRHTGDFERFDGSTDDGTEGCYVVADQHLAGPADGAGPGGIGAFLQYGWADPMLSPIEHHVGTGLAWTGPSAQRPADVAGLGFSYGRFTRSAAAGLHGDGELAVELFYRVQVAPWWQLQPVVHWIHEPGGAGLDDAFVLTLRAALTF